MRFPTVPRRHAVVAVVSACGLVAVLLLTRPAPVAAPAKSAGSTALALAWVDGGRQLEVSGDGYRPDGIVDIRLGSDPIQQARAGKTGQVLVNVPQPMIAAGEPGASVVVVGRSKIGTFRALVSAVPPRASGRGPMVVLPWVVAGVVLLRLLLAVVRSVRRIGLGRTVRRAGGWLRSRPAAVRRRLVAKGKTTGC